MTDGSPHHPDDASTRAATAATAAVLLQLAEEGSLKDIAEPVSCHPPETGAAHPVRHPSAALFDSVVVEVALVVKDYAAFKNIAVTEQECWPLARRALHGFSRKTLRGILDCKPHAIEFLRASVDATLDILAAARMIAAIDAMNGAPELDDHVMLARAETAVRKMNIPSANTRVAMRVWPDLDKIVIEICKRMRAGDEASIQRIQLPEGSPVRCAVDIRSKPMTQALRAATPDRQGWFDG